MYLYDIDVYYFDFIRSVFEILFDELTFTTYILRQQFIVYNKENEKNRENTYTAV